MKPPTLITRDEKHYRGFRSKPEKDVYKYIIASKRNGTIHTDMKINLTNRIYQHQNHLIQGSSAKYNCNILACIEYFDDMQCNCKGKNN